MDDGLLGFFFDVVFGSWEKLWLSYRVRIDVCPRVGI